MKKYLSALCMVTSLVAHGRDTKNTLNKSVYAVYASLPANKAATEATVQNVAKSFPGWTAFTNKLNGTFTDLVGPAIKLPGAALQDKAANCITQKLNRLGVKATEWAEVKGKLTSDNYVRYRQSIHGHNVFMTSLVFRFTEDAKLVKIRMQNYGNNCAAEQPSIGAASAKEYAVNDLTGVKVTSAAVSANWDWFPVPTKNGYELHPAWAYKIIGKSDKMPVILHGYVDGITGEVLMRSNDVKDDFNLTVKGNVYKNGTLQPATLEPLANLQMSVGANNYFTNDTGYLHDPSLILPLSPNIFLAGKWSTVVDVNSFTTPMFVDAVNVNNTIYTYPTLAPSSSRHINAYYHTNKVHDYMKSHFPTFTSLDFSLPTNVDDNTGDCNAFYDGSAINFFAEDAICYSFAEIGDIIYHEYGHGISDHMYTDINGITMQNGAMNEGNSDVWALCIFRNPILGQNCFVGSGGFIRRYDITPQLYPQDWQPPFTDPHYIGQILVGSWWDVATNLGNIDSMAKLFTDVYWDAPDDFDGNEAALYRSILIDALVADDNDANINNGTPHYKKIVAAFAKHGIYLSGDMTFSFAHQELNNQPPNVAIPVTASLSAGIPPFFSKLRLYYKKDYVNTWDSVTLTTANNQDFTGNIPAMQPGTVVNYYLAIVDALGVPNAYFPSGYNPVTASSQTSIPYQFAVGVVAKDSQNFEQPATGWHIGNQPGDNAFSGQWTQTTLTAVGNPWPSGDHTTTFGSSLFTGSPQSNEDVSGGATTALSPVFDVTGYTKPVIEYYRWFSNDMGENFKSDPFKVLIRDANNNNWIAVENTYQSDLNWRKRIFAVSQYLPQGTNHIQMKLQVSDSSLTDWFDNGQSLTIAGMDDFYLYDAAGPNDVKNVTQVKASIYPNPADGQLIISFSQADNNGYISLQDIKGREVYKATLSPGSVKYEVNISNLAAGIYNLVIQNNKSLQSQKVTIRHN
ncbi:MAG: T9SS type A sorting domain-containing protein [Bacteroidetes bacterium]|nr:T9SS type A sorting domain-containing protein [Bacteroidota bacterium]